MASPELSRGERGAAIEDELLLLWSFFTPILHVLLRSRVFSCLFFNPLYSVSRCDHVIFVLFHQWYSMATLRVPMQMNVHLSKVGTSPSLTHLNNLIISVKVVLSLLSTVF